MNKTPQELLNELQWELDKKKNLVSFDMKTSIQTCTLCGWQTNPKRKKGAMSIHQTRMHNESRWDTRELKEKIVFGKEMRDSIIAMIDEETLVLRTKIAAMEISIVTPERELVHYSLLRQLDILENLKAQILGGKQ